MRQLLRVLEPGGWAILQSPVDTRREKTLEDPNIVTPQDRERFNWYEYSIRLYGRDYRQSLQEGGFLVKVDPFARTLGDEVIRRYGLNDGDIYFCRKPPSVGNLSRCSADFPGCCAVPTPKLGAGSGPAAGN